MTEQVQYRSYRGGDDGEIIALWNRSLSVDPIDEATWRAKVLCDPNFLPEGLIVAWEGDRAVGFVLALVRRIPLWGDDLERENGWITAFGVDPERRGRGFGRALLEQAERFLAEEGRRYSFFASYAPNYFLPGIDSETYPAGAHLLAARGYGRLYQCVAMDRSLVGFEIPDDVASLRRAREAEGYTFQRLDTAHLAETIRFANDDFNPDWGRAMREAVAGGVPMDRSLIALHPDGRVVGFCIYGAYGGVGERFGPFGVAGSERGKGLGKILLYECLKRMQAAGLHGAWFLWTGETSPAGRLYVRAGFTVTRRFDVLRKELTAGA